MLFFVIQIKSTNPKNPFARSNFRHNIAFSEQKADDYISAWSDLSKKRRVSLAESLKLSLETFQSLLQWIDEKLMVFCEGSRVRLAYR